MARSKKIQSYKVGLWAEFIAALYLRAKGYKIIEQRYKTKVGEIDILAQRKNALVAVEVKARKSHDAAVLSVTPKAKGRIERALLLFVSHNARYTDFDFRFDVITIKMPFFIRHIDNAWQPRA